MDVHPGLPARGEFGGDASIRELPLVLVEKNEFTVRDFKDRAVGKEERHIVVHRTLTAWSVRQS